MYRLIIITSTLFYSYAYSNNTQEEKHPLHKQVQKIDDLTKKTLDKIIKTINYGKNKAVKVAEILSFNEAIKTIQNHPYKDKVAQVKYENSLHPQEIAFIKNRLSKANEAMERLTGEEIEGKTPKIAIVASGGGYRAMLSTVGSLVEAEKNGLLDTVSYLVGLSGSTWAMAGWLSRDISLEEYRELIKEKVSKKISKMTPKEFKLLMDALFIKYSSKQKMTLVDFYGAMLANVLFDDFGKNRHKIHLSFQSQKLEDASTPLPLYSAVRRARKMPTSWFEFSPYEIGSAKLKAYVPPWAFGRNFDESGKSTDFSPEQSLGYLLGIFGSAFAAEFKKMYIKKLATLNEPEKKLAAKILKSIDTVSYGEIIKVGDKRIRFSWAEPNNFTRSPGSFRLVDAGIDFNLPYPLVSGIRPERKADIIIFWDYSGNIENLLALRKSEEYARENNLNFPKIEYAEILDRTVSVFKDSNEETPLIIYMPLVKGEGKIEDRFKKQLENFNPITCEKKGFCSTFNFRYTDTQAEQLMSQAEFNMQASFNTIKEAIKWKIKQMNQTEIK